MEPLLRVASWGPLASGSLLLCPCFLNPKPGSCLCTGQNSRRMESWGSEPMLRRVAATTEGDDCPFQCSLSIQTQTLQHNAGVFMGLQKT